MSEENNDFWFSSEDSGSISNIDNPAGKNLDLYMGENPVVNIPDGVVKISSSAFY